jgi:hypothetical protein
MTQDQQPVPGMEPDLGEDDEQKRDPDELDPVTPRQDEKTREEQINQRLGSSPNR